MAKTKPTPVPKALVAAAGPAAPVQPAAAAICDGHPSQSSNDEETGEGGLNLPEIDLDLQEPSRELDTNERMSTFQANAALWYVARPPRRRWVARSIIGVQQKAQDAWITMAGAPWERAETIRRSHASGSNPHESPEPTYRIVQAAKGEMTAPFFRKSIQI